MKTNRNENLLALFWSSLNIETTQSIGTKPKHFLHRCESGHQVIMSLTDRRYIRTVKDQQRLEHQFSLEDQGWYQQLPKLWTWWAGAFLVPPHPCAAVAILAGLRSSSGVVLLVV
jgi:hypothetical protein